MLNSSKDHLWCCVLMAEICGQLLLPCGERWSLNLCMRDGSNWKVCLSSSVLCVYMAWNSPFEALKFVALGWCKQLTRNPGTLLLDLCRQVSPQLSIPCLTPLDFFSWKPSLICSICLVQSGTWLKGCAEHKTPQLQLQLNFSWAWISVWWAEGSSYLWLGWNLGM